MTASKMLTPAQAAAATGLTPHTIRKLAKRGEIPGAVPPQREWQIPRASLQAIPRRKRGRQKGVSNA